MQSTDGCLILKKSRGDPRQHTERQNSKRHRQTGVRLSYTFFIMGTRSRIGIQLKDDSILSVYCHWDGYPSFNGRVLREFYNTPEKVADLINGGNISSLHTNVGWNNETLPETGPQYYTSRGESLEENAPRYDESIFDFLKKENNEEYAYIWTVNNKWVCRKMNQFDDDKQPEKVEIPAGTVG
mgnify:CR=1 FL=1